MDTDDAIEQAFMVTRLVCANCGHEIEDDELGEQRAHIKEELDVEVASATVMLELGLLRCLDCGEFSVREVDVDLRDDLLRAAQEAGQRARTIVERNPDLRPRVEEALTEARSHVDGIVRGRA